MKANFLSYLLEITHSTECHEAEVIQTLWGGYGQISRYKLQGSKMNSVVVKCISLEQVSEHPRGWSTDFAHSRKVKSYKVETNWYEHYSSLCSNRSKIPQFIGSFSKDNQHWIILEDLNSDFPQIKKEVDIQEIKLCLTWLAYFHIKFIDREPIGLWEVGTYWHLATRPEEFEKIQNEELKIKAHIIDNLLNSCKYKTLVHGDAKLANFCFSRNSEKVAAVDFQYIGGGCGVKDVVYFLGSCLSASGFRQHEAELLDYYFSQLREAGDFFKSKIDMSELEREWRSMYHLASADFTRFMMGWMPSHYKINEYTLGILDSVLSEL